jgi:hydrogenase maturation protease
MSVSSPDPPPLILGLGNPILSDDRVGLEVARSLHAQLPDGSALLCEASVGGMELLHVLEGHRRVVLIDAFEPGRLEPGAVAELGLEELEASYTPLSPHTAGLRSCLEFGRLCGLEMPAEVRVFVVGTCEVRTFSERCTPSVEAAIPRVVEEIRRRAFAPAAAGASRA